MLLTTTRGVGRPWSSSRRVFGGSNEQGALVDLSNEYASRGWVIFSINYRLAAQRGTVPQSWLNAVQFLPEGTNLDQALAMYPANRELRSTALGGEPSDGLALLEQVSVLGGSAGATAAIAAVVSNDEDYATELSVIQDPTLLSNLTESIEVQTILDFGVPARKVDALTALDGEERFEFGDAPLMIVHGTADPTVAYSEATSLNATYEANGNPNSVFHRKRCHGIWGATVNGAPLWSLGFDFASGANKG